MELWLFALVWGSAAYFFQGGGWNQNAHFATTVALVEHGTFCVDAYRDSTGDLAQARGCLASAKPVGTALALLPGHLVARLLTAGVNERGNQSVARAYLTTVLGPALALAGFAVLLFGFARRRLADRDALLVALATTLATPLWPLSTMTNSTPFVALAALWGVTRLFPADGARLGARALFWAGVGAGLPACFEYQTAVIIVPLAAVAWWRAAPRRGVVLFLAGLAAIAVAPLGHHALVYGHPLKVGYAALVMPGMAAAANDGFFGLDGLSLARLYDLTLGDTRGYLFLSPFLVAAVPGLLALARDPTRRAEALAFGGAAWLVLLTVASLGYWHSGWGIASRYATLFPALSGPLVAEPLPRHRGWVGVGVAAGFAIALLAASVTATPPPPGRRPAELTVVGWLYDQLTAGRVAFRNEPVLVEPGVAPPSWRTSFNLGQLAGLPGRASLLPFLVLLAAGLWLGWRWTRCPVATASHDPNDRA